MIEITNLGTAFRINTNFHNKSGLDVNVSGETVAIKRYGQVILDTTHYSAIKYAGSAITNADGLVTMATALVQAV